MRAGDRLIPRTQQGAASQQLVIVLLGDYWHLRPEPLPSGALVDLLALFDVTAAAARAAIQRLSHRGFLIGSREGRTTSYAVTPMSHDRATGAIEVLFGETAPAWDGTWTLVSYSVPEDARETRNALREQLRQDKFGNLYDALWVRPGDHAERVVAAAAALRHPVQDSQLTVFTSARTATPLDPDLIRSAFGIDELAADYAEFLARWQPLADRLSTGTTEWVAAERADDEPIEARALRTRTSIMREWRHLRHRDPGLPADVIGTGFPASRAREVCAVVYDTLGPLAERAFQGTLLTHAPELAPLVAHHTFARPPGR